MSARVRRIERVVWRWADFSRRHARGVVAAWGFLTVLSAVFASTLTVDTDTSRMISDRAGFRQAQLAFEARFPELDDRILVLVRARTQDAAERYADGLAEALEAYPDAIAQAYAPAADPFFRRNGLLFQGVDDLTATLARLSRSAPLIDTLNQTPTLDAFLATLADAVERAEPESPEAQTLTRVQDELAAVIEARLAGDPRGLSWRALFADADQAAPAQVLLTVTPRLDYSRLRPAAPAQLAIDSAAEIVRMETGLDAEVFVTGEPVLRSDELRSVRDGIEIAGLISLILVAVLLYFGYRSGMMAAVTVGIVVISILVTAGLASIVFGALNLVSVAFTVLMVGLGVDFAIHFALHALVEHRRGKSSRAALYRTSREIGGALALTAPTTALAFFAFTPTDFVGMAQLGMLAGMGVLVAFLAATSIVPALFALPETQERLRRGPILGAGPARPRLAGAAGLVILTLTAGALFLLPQARFDADPMSLRDPDAPSVRAFQLLFDDINTQPYRLDVIAETPEAAAQLGDQLGALEAVSRTTTLLDFVPDAQAEKLDLIDFAAAGLIYALEPGPQVDPGGFGDGAARLRAALAAAEDPAAQRLAEALETVTQRDEPALEGAIGADVFRHWPYQRERLATSLTAGPVTLADLPAPLIERYVSPDGGVRVEVLPEGDARLLDVRRDFVEAVLEVAPDAAGSARSVLEAGQVISEAMIQAALTAFAGVALLLWLVLRQAGIVAAILIPLAMAAILTTATGVLIGMPYNFANVIVLPLLIGAGVDSGIHLAMRARKTRNAFAVLRTTTPRAVVFAALTTVGSFGSLAISDHRGTASMGILLMVALFWTLACTLFILPWLAERLDRRSAPANTTP